ncbi:CRISPR-associated endonuclease Cas2 [Methanocalculus sp. MC3]
MFVWVFYDITSNKLRQQIADACMDDGLTRFQKSIFFGELSTPRMKKLGSRIEGIFGGYPSDDKTEADSVLLFSLCDSCLNEKIVIGRTFNEDTYRKQAFVIL